MTIKDIEKQMEATEKAREQLAKTKQENEEQAKEYRAKADAAAIAGDVASYKELKALADDAEAVAYVCGKQLEAEQGNAVTPEQTQEAWADYAKAYNKKLADKLDKAKKAKAEYLREYMEAVDLQREACRTRERLAACAGVKEHRAEGFYPMDYIPCNTSNNGRKPVVDLRGTAIQDPDAVALLASLGLDGADLAGDERQRIVFSVVFAHKAC